MKRIILAVTVALSVAGCSGTPATDGGTGGGGGSTGGGGGSTGGGGGSMGDAGLGVSTGTLADGGSFLNLDEAVGLQYPGYANREVDPQLTQVALPAAETAPNFMPMAGSPALTGGATPPNDGFFDPTATFVGAVGATDWTQGWTAYPDTAAGTPEPMGKTRETVTGSIMANTTWTADKIWVLDGIIHVGDATNTSPVVLTIEPGTQIRGKKGSALVVTKTGRLVADGTSTSPIVFTADFPPGMVGLPGNNWGGVVLNGKGDLNMPGKDNLAEGLADEARNRYGGGSGVDAAHDCGTLKYVRIEFAGEPLSATNELNGLTFNACGSGTTVDFVQIHRGIDDGLEIFGGSVNVKHLVITGSDDDGIDWDRGWTGKGQFLIVQQLDGRGNHGIEADNWSNDNDAQPRSKPTLYNLTLVGRSPQTDNGTGGEGSSRGVTLRVGSAGEFHNMIVTRFSRWGLFIDSPASVNAWAGGESFIKNSIFFNNSSTTMAGWSDVKP